MADFNNIFEPVNWTTGQYDIKGLMGNRAPSGSQFMEDIYAMKAMPVKFGELQNKLMEQKGLQAQRTFQPGDSKGADYWYRLADAVQTTDPKTANDYRTKGDEFRKWEMQYGKPTSEMWDFIAPDLINVTDQAGYDQVIAKWEQRYPNLRSWVPAEWNANTRTEILTRSSKTKNIIADEADKDKNVIGTDTWIDKMFKAYQYAQREASMLTGAQRDEQLKNMENIKSTLARYPYGRSLLGIPEPELKPYNENGAGGNTPSPIETTTKTAEQWLTEIKNTTTKDNIDNINTALATARTKNEISDTEYNTLKQQLDDKRKALAPPTPKEKKPESKDAYKSFLDGAKATIEKILGAIALGTSMKGKIESSQKELSQSDTQQLAAMIYQTYNPGTLVSGEMSSAVNALQGAKSWQQYVSSGMSKLGISAQNTVSKEKAMQSFNSAINAGVDAYNDFTDAVKRYKNNPDTDYKLIDAFLSGMKNPKNYIISGSSSTGTTTQTKPTTAPQAGYEWFYKESIQKWVQRKK